MDAESRVRAFCDAFARRDTKEILGFLAKDALYHNLPLACAPRSRGHRAHAAGLFLGPCVRGRVRNGGHRERDRPRVLTERIDRFVLANGTTHRAAGDGQLRARRGRLITEWRDYFDLATWTRQMQGSAAAS